MQAYLELIASGQMNFEALIDRVVPIDDAPATYDELAKADGALPLGVLIHYPAETGRRRRAGARRRCAAIGRRRSTASTTRWSAPAHSGRRCSSRRCESARIATSCAASSAAPAPQGSNFARDNQVEILTSDLDAVLRDPEFQLVVIATRHHDHADQVVRSLAAGKHVFVEKPLATSWEGLEQVVSAYDGDGRARRC